MTAARSFPPVERAQAREAPGAAPAGMEKARELQEAHQALLEQMETQAGTAEFLQAVTAYIERVRSEAAEVSEPSARDQLRADLRFWASFAFEKTHAYPDITLSPPLTEALVDDSGVLRLWMEIDRLESKLAAEGAARTPWLERSLDRLTAARGLMIHDRSRFEEAQRLVAAVEYELAAYRRQARAVPWIAASFVLWLGLSAGGLLFLDRLLAAGPVGVRLAAGAALWGALGGTLIAAYRLWRHLARIDDFDPQMTLWYLAAPVTGLVLGALVLVVVDAGVSLFSTGGLRSDNLALYALAFLAGLGQSSVFNYLTAQTGRLLGQIPGG